MSIDVETKDLGKVVQLVAKSDGWKKRETIFNIDRNIFLTGDPNPGIIYQTAEELVPAYRAAWLTTREKRPTDFNGLKVAVRALSVIDGILITDAVQTDYFTLWGLPQTEESKPLFAEHERQIVQNRFDSPNALYETSLPWGICTHNVLLDINGDVLMMIRSMSQGFNQGRVSVTEEGQMEPDDASPFFASHRSFTEELGLFVPEQRISLLGVAMEKGAAYPAYAFVGETDTLARNIVEKWKGARDYNENTALFAVPMTEIDKWLSEDEISSDIWQRNFMAGNVAPDAKLKLHNTSAWRLNLARQFTQASK